MTVQAYILIQTEVGKAASVAAEIAKIKGVTMAEDVTGPYDVIVRSEARSVDELGKLVVAKVQGRARHHPHPHLPGRPPLDTGPSLRRPASAPLSLGVARRLRLLAGCGAGHSAEPRGTGTREVCATSATGFPPGWASCTRA